jgi:hypothetical protein
MTCEWNVNDWARRGGESARERESGSEREKRERKREGRERETRDETYRFDGLFL